MLFPSGQQKLERKIRTAHELAILLEMEPPRNIIISGHTDNIPIRTASFQSNWELSVMRAINFMKVLMEDENLDPGGSALKDMGNINRSATTTR